MEARGKAMGGAGLFGAGGYGYGGAYGGQQAQELARLEHVSPPAHPAPSSFPKTFALPLLRRSLYSSFVVSTLTIFTTYSSPKKQSRMPVRPPLSIDLRAIIHYVFFLVCLFICASQLNCIPQFLRPVPAFPFPTSPHLAMVAASHGENISPWLPFLSWCLHQIQ